MYTDEQKFQLTLPINLEKIIATDDEVFTLKEICEELDFSELERKFRKNIYNPITIFKIIVYGYMCGIYSSRGIEKAKELLEAREKYALQFATFKGRSNFSKTDTDATFMHMKEDHMKNGQLKPGYNIQIAVDSEYIVNTGTFSNRADTLTLIPFFKDTDEKVRKYKEIVADAGYESEENYVFLNKEGQTSFIKPLNYEQLKKKQSKYHHSNFQYIAEKDIFICPEGNEMTFKYLKNVKSASGYISEKRVFKTNQCQNCPNREKCTTSETGRSIEYSSLLEKYIKQSLENITSEHGIELRVNRSIQVEGAFGVLKQDYHFRRFLTRGKENVSTEMLLLCFAFNVNKYNHKQRDKRTQTYLFKIEAA